MKVFIPNIFYDYFYRFTTYGNFPLEGHLEYINTKYLENFDQIQVNTAVPNQPRWTKPVC